jgi:hypothetical protein
MRFQFGEFQENGNVIAIYPSGIAQKVNPNNSFVRVKDLRARATK